MSVRATNAAQITVTVDNLKTSTTTTMHVGDLDGVGVKLEKDNWQAPVTITVHDGNENPVRGATVTGKFHQNGTFVKQVSCRTGNDAHCTVDSGQFPNEEGKAPSPWTP